MTDRPRLLVKRIDAPRIRGEQALALCWEDGSPVGWQTGCDISFDVAELGRLTVRLLIDGDAIALA